MGNRSRWCAPQGCYRCAGEDNWLVITVRDDAEWTALCHAMGHTEWTDDPRFADIPARFENHDELDALITSWTEGQDHLEAMRRLQEAGVIAAAVLNPKQVLLDPHMRERGFFETVEHTDVGPKPMPRQLGARFSAFETDARGPAPKLGEHNRDVLQGILGLSDTEIAQLEERNVIGDTPDLALPLDVMRMFVQMPTTTYLGMGALAAIEPDYRKQLGLE
jgi:crotonobetainyl-CoA:carnitine CoA-transferase CaiB-like acyl-CoA transferase